MNVELSPKSIRFYNRLNEPMRSRISAALHKLEEEPPQGDIKALNDGNWFRVRVGKYRILFSVAGSVVRVHEIGLRGQIYKGR